MVPFIIFVGCLLQVAEFARLLDALPSCLSAKLDTTASRSLPAYPEYDRWSGVAPVRVWLRWTLCGRCPVGARRGAIAFSSGLTATSVLPDEPPSLFFRGALLAPGFHAFCAAFLARGTQGFHIQLRRVSIPLAASTAPLGARWGANLFSVLISACTADT